MNSLLRLSVLLLLFQGQALGQPLNSQLKEPEVGKPCPEFVLNKIDFYKSKTLRLSDLKGKWVVVDFWSKGCSGCVASLPKISREQMAFKDSVQFVMVGPEARPDDRELYKGYQQKLHLQMPSAFDDALFKSFNVGLLPHTIIIDPKGIVRAITTSADSLKLRQLMAGQSPVFKNADYADDKQKLTLFKYNSNSPYLVNNNGGIDSEFLFRSLLTKWNPGNPSRFSPIKDNPWDIKRGVFELLSGSLIDLYMLAYYGKTKITREDSGSYGVFFSMPIFEIKNMDLLNTDRATGENLYCYSLKVPPEKATEKYIMQVMQSDLKNYFGYEVCIEAREMPYWRLIATDEGRNKLKTRGGETKAISITPWQKASFKNYPMKKLIALIEYYTDGTLNDEPLLDETGITTNVDIDLDWVKGDYTYIRKALQINGLDLVPGRRQMKCFVIREPKSENTPEEAKN